MQTERADKAMGIVHEDEVVLRSKELEIELRETRMLLWLVLHTAGRAPGMCDVQLSDLPHNYDIDIYKTPMLPGVVTLTAITK